MSPRCRFWIQNTILQFLFLLHLFCVTVTAPSIILSFFSKLIYYNSILITNIGGRVFIFFFIHLFIAAAFLPILSISISSPYLNHQKIFFNYLLFQYYYFQFSHFLNYNRLIPMNIRGRFLFTYLGNY